MFLDCKIASLPVSTLLSLEGKKSLRNGEFWSLPRGPSRVLAFFLLEYLLSKHSHKTLLQSVFPTSLGTGGDGDIPGGEAEAQGGAWGGAQRLGQVLWVPPLSPGREIGEGREGRGSEKVWAG